MTDAIEPRIKPRPFAVDVVATLEDQMVFNAALVARPEVVRRRRIWSIVLILVLPPIGFASGLVAAHVDDDPSPVLGVLGNVSAAEWWDAAASTLAASGSIAAVLFLLHLLRRPMLRLRVRHILSERPGIDPQDPELREHVRAIFDFDGYTAKGRGATTSITWPFVRGIEDHDGLLIVQVGRNGGFLLPKRDLSAEQIDAIVAFVQAHAGDRPDLRERSFVSPWEQEVR